MLKRHKLPKENQEEIENMNSPISIKETEFANKILPTKKTPGSEEPRGKTGIKMQTY